MPKTNEYLYGSKSVLTPIPDEIIKERIKVLNKHLKTLLNEPYEIRDSVRVKDVKDGISFWEKINEM